MRAAVVALASLLVASPLAAEPAPPRDASPDKKGAHVDVAAAEPPPVLATLWNVHTGESVVLSATEPSVERFSDLLSDRATGTRAELDPRLLDLLRAVAKKADAPRIELVSGYRSTKLNEMLRKKGHKVASHSQHSRGHAVDFRVEGLGPKETHALLVKLGWTGGIGQYDAETDRFVHADVGPKRAWFER